MNLQLIWGILLPFLGTAVGAAGVLLLRRTAPAFTQICSAVAAGIMTAAAIWSLLLPALDACAPACWPPLTGIWLGAALMRGADLLLLRLQQRSGRCRGAMGQIALPIFAITVHNIPEGMAVGAAFAAAGASDGDISCAAAFALALGIAIQNLPEGAVVSLPLYAAGHGKGRAFLCGVLSGAVEPIAAVLTLLLAGALVPLLPCLLGLAAGAMLFAVAASLLPDAAADGRRLPAALLFLAGFSLMMVLDVALG